MAKILQYKKRDWYQFKITLEHVRPSVWRRFTVDSNSTLQDLHKIIQTVMGWTNSHLHLFRINGELYAEPDDEAFEEYIDYRTVKLFKIFSQEKESISYEYDFGDGWEHTIVLEKFLPDHDRLHPRCLGGKRNCPPEDCGGPFGFTDLIRIISDPQDEQYNDIMDWLGGEYDPDYFDIDQVNEMLQDDDFGCLIL